MTEQVHTFKSNAVGNERSIWIRQPKSGLPAENLVVILDAEIYREHVGATVILDNLEELVDSRALFVFVSMHSVDARWIECPCHPPFAEFIIKELLPWIAELHPEVASPKERVLVGLSYTGLAAAYVAYEAKGLLTKVIAQSGSFWSNDCDLTKRYEALDAPFETAFILDVGRSETDENVRHKEDVLQVISQIEGVQRFRDALIVKGFAVKYIEYDGGHDAAKWAETLPGEIAWTLGLRS